MSKTVDKILEILDQPLQHSPEHGYPNGSTREDTCWRCGVVLPELTPLGACERCVTDLQSERPAPKDWVESTRWGAVCVNGSPFDAESWRFVRDFAEANEEFGRVSLDVVRAMTTISGYIEAAFAGDAPGDSIYIHINDPRPTPNVRFVDQHGNTTHPDQYIENPGHERLVPVFDPMRGVQLSEGSALETLGAFHVERYEARGIDAHGMLLYVRVSP